MAENYVDDLPLHEPCENCGIKPRRNPAFRSLECEACAKYRQRTGQPRPFRLIEAQLERERRTAGGA